MWFARYKISATNEHKILELLELPHVDAAMKIVLKEDEALSSITNSEAMSFLESRSASFIDGEFQTTVPDLGMVQYTLNEIKDMRVDELRQYTNRFIVSNSLGKPRYPMDMQASLNRVYSKIERKLRLCAIPDNIKEAIAGKTIGIAKVYEWITGFLERNNASREVMDQAAALKTQYQAGTVTTQQIFQWAIATLADIEAQYNAKIDRIDAVNDWIQKVLDMYYSAKGSIAASNTVDELKALSWDYSVLDATDPGLSLSDVL